MSSIKKTGIAKDGYKAFTWKIPFSLLAIKRERDNLRLLPSLAPKEKANSDESLSRVEPQAVINEAVLCQLKELSRSKNSGGNPFYLSLKCPCC